MHIGLVHWNHYTCYGGLEKFTSNLATAMHNRGHKVTLFHQGNSRSRPEPYYPVDSGIAQHSLALGNYYFNTPDHVQKMARAKELIAQSALDVLTVPLSWNVLLLFPALVHGTDTPLLISEHSNPSLINNERWNAYEREACLAAADSIHMLSPQYKEMSPAFLHERIQVIPNAVPHLATAGSSLPPKSNTYTLLAAGRFNDDIKQFSLLLHAFSLIKDSFPHWNLTLCGSGKDASQYKNLIQQLHLAGRVTMPGMVSCMADYYSQSDLFCIPSRFEGFPLTILEAQSFSLPAVGFAQCSGTNEIIVHDANGLLAPEMTAESLAQSLSQLMANPEQREAFGKRGREMLARYSEDTVYDAWEALLIKTAQAKGNTRLQQLPPALPAEERCKHALREILDRKAPFSRPTDSRGQAILQQEEARVIRRMHKNELVRKWLPASIISLYKQLRSK